MVLFPPVDHKLDDIVHLVKNLVLELVVFLDKMKRVELGFKFQALFVHLADNCSQRTNCNREEDNPCKHGKDCHELLIEVTNRDIAIANSNHGLGNPVEAGKIPLKN